MADTTGKIGWIDMSVDNAESVRDFYKAVVGWGHEDVSMGDYADYSMTAAGGEAVSGICHARGSNAELPSGWLIYITVDDVEASAVACEAHGGEVIVPVQRLAGGRFCVIRDPAGATAALYQP
jgi:predicted enzyme related to lactoylglutathione lyase